MGDSPGDVGAVPVTYVKQRKNYKMSSDVGEAAEWLENELWYRWSDEGLENGAEPHSPTLISLELPHSSFSKSSAASHTSQLNLQTFRYFIYVKWRAAHVRHTLLDLHFTTTLLNTVIKIKGTGTPHILSRIYCPIP